MNNTTPTEGAAFQAHLDRYGISFTEAGQILGHSRQFIADLVSRETLPTIYAMVITLCNITGMSLREVPPLGRTR